MELAKVDTATLTPDARKNWEEKRAKHEAVVTVCEQTGRTNLVTTAPSAGLLKSPDGASAPGHRTTVTACGVKTRMVVPPSRHRILINPVSLWKGQGSAPTGTP